MMSTNRPTRRSFLTGRAVLRESSTAAPVPSRPVDRQAIPSPSASAGTSDLPVDRSALLVNVGRRAMACDWEVQLSASRNDDSMEHIFAALDLVEALEQQMTIYREDSEITRMNGQAGTSPVRVEPRLFALLQLAERTHRETGGALDITCGPLSDAWGFSRRKGRVPSDAEIAAALVRVGMQHVKLDAANKTIAFQRHGVAVNLNSIGKGYALDRMAELLADAHVDDYLLHGGKSRRLRGR